ncbi:protein kinase [Mesorhizobium sp. CAU 1741]|uniref:protein kinase domain-containing protein n=1 Tax=Mesorhizobium sp. CAU 1741 TaxID=3140366 RepID=UPI00325C33E0
MAVRKPWDAERRLSDRDGIEVVEARGDHGEPIIVKRAADPGRVDAVMRLRHEIGLWTMLHHPGLPVVQGAGENWIAFERLDASLTDPVIQARHCHPAQARLLIARLAETLAYLHGRGIVHRDLKPAHVLFRSSQPVLIDLGLAVLAGSDPVQGSEVAGSAAWMSPEQVRGAPPSASDDIWSLSAIAAWLVGGKALYSGNADAVLDARQDGAAPDLRLERCRNVDEDLAAIIEAGLGPAAARPRAGQMVHVLSG